MTVSPTKASQVDGSPLKASQQNAHSFEAAKETALKNSLTQCEEQMIKRDFQAAYTIIVESVKDAVALYGKSTLSLVPYYLMMAEIGLELSHMNQVEEVLALCSWNIVKAAEEDAANETRTLDLRANVSKLYAKYHCECEHFEEAIKQAANGAYYASLVHGPEHIQTATLYFTLGSTFQKMFQTEEALGMFDKVVEIWYKFLAAATSTRGKEDDTSNRPDSPKKEIRQIPQRIHHQGVGILNHILDARGKVLGETHIATGEVLYTMGLLNVFLGDVSNAKNTITKALAIYTDALGSLHPSTMDVQSVFDQL